MEIRRIRDGEGEAVGRLWDRMCKGTSRALAEAAIAWLRERGAHTLRYQSCVDAEDDHGFWQSLGFEPDMVCLSSYLQ